MSLKTLSANPDDAQFLNAIKDLKEGEVVETREGKLKVEYRFDVPTHFTFHQRIFPAGMILHKEGSKIRIFVEAEKLGMEAKPVEEGYFEERK